MVDFIKILNNKKIKPPSYDHWKEVFDIMRSHTLGDVPEKIFRKRRPLESEAADGQLLDYRKNNHFPTTQGEFKKAINDYIEVIQNVDVKDNIDAEFREYLDSIKIDYADQWQGFDEWIDRSIAEWRQTDPNTRIVVFPVYRDNPFIPSYEFDVPDYNGVKNQYPDVDLIKVDFDKIVSVGNDHILYNAGKYELKEVVDKYYVGVTKEQTFLYIPFVDDEKMIRYKEVPYYRNNLPRLPVFTISDIVACKEGKEFFLPDFFGAAAWGDKYYGIDSDLNVAESRFIFLRHWKIKVKCDQKGCSADPTDGKHYIITNKPDGNTDRVLCPKCKGSGKIMDSSPFGTWEIDPKGGLFSNGQVTAPEGFIAPPADILKHNADRADVYFAKMQGSLNIFNQNMTNQSAESKYYDHTHAVTTKTRIATFIYKLKGKIVNTISYFRGGEGGYYYQLPDSLDVMTANDIVIELADAKSKNLPYPVILDLTKKYYIKKHGDTARIKRIVDYLSLKDSLFAYGLNELNTAKAALGSDINPTDIAIHSFGFQILRNILTDNPEISDEELNNKFDEEITSRLTRRQTAIA